MTTATVGQLFAADTVLLCVERDASMGGVRKAGDGASECTKGCLTNFEGNIFQSEWAICARVTVFTRAQQKEEANPGHVNSGPSIVISGVGYKCMGMVEDLDGERFDPRGGRVCAGPCRIEVREA